MLATSPLLWTLEFTEPCSKVLRHKLLSRKWIFACLECLEKLEGMSTCVFSHKNVRDPMLTESEAK